MSNFQTRAPNVNITNSKRADPANQTATSNFANPAHYASIGALDAALTTANGAYYTQTRLDQMTVNDKVFALRGIEDSKTFSDYMPAQTA